MVWLLENSKMKRVCIFRYNYIIYILHLLNKKQESFHACNHFLVYKHILSKMDENPSFWRKYAYNYYQRSTSTFISTFGKKTHKKFQWKSAYKRQLLLYKQKLAKRSKTINKRSKMTENPSFWRKCKNSKIYLSIHTAPYIINYEQKIWISIMIKNN